ncbi:hypothetical protein BGZ63DRAFT_427741 [Mariannaea sp. PMI_226]|nr:hypothetical protein BGZ63DRAFT_427741 [Mariannaea sp. PMI_226]
MAKNPLIANFFARLCTDLMPNSFLLPTPQQSEQPSGDEPPDPDIPSPSSPPSAQIHSQQRIDSSPGGGRTREWKPNRVKIGFEMLPDFNVMDPKHLDWLATLEVVTKDIIRLMEEGFYWSKDNILRRKGYFEFGEKVSHLAKEQGWNCTRIYFLADIKKENGQPLWTAKLTIFARDLRTLSQFDLACLTVERIVLAAAVDQSRLPIYGYYALQPEFSFNALLDGMPLRGWWPWPRSQEG